MNNTNNAVLDGPTLRQLRKSRGLSQAELAVKLNLKESGKSQISRYENGGEIPLRAQKRILQVFEPRPRFSMSPAVRIYSVAILIFSALALLGFYFFQAFSVPGSISQSGYPEKFAAFYKTLPQWMLKEKQTSYALWTQLSEKQQAQLPGALKNYTDYEMRQAASRGQTTLTEGYVCKDKNFLKPGGHACGFENYIEPISIVGGVE